MSVKYITCNNLNNIKHGFFTRNGGHSSGVYDSMNCGPGSNDDAQNVRKNRKAAMQALGYADETNLYTLCQIHSDKVIHIDSVPEKRYEADALVTSTPGVALGILTADCTPILFADSNNGVIGAAHAGWKGAIGGVIENTINQMEELGAKRTNIKVAIGPTISQSSYEVGPEFYDNFLKEDSNNSMFFIPSVKAGHFMFNLPLYVAYRLEKAGIESIEDSALDTCSMRESFFSYRRNCLEGIKDYGRNLSVIVL